MIPIQIQIKNFLSYSGNIQTINFSPYHLIYLSGKNGHGKSALLDAMSWALWGYARKTTMTSKADAGLLRLGQSHMIVIFDFECNGTRYRVRREYLHMPSKPQTTLDFGILEATTNKFCPLTEKTIRKTQEVINQTLKLTFTSFINSAFLRQGEANEFSKKSPKERKDVLAHILGITHYEYIRRYTTEKIKEVCAHRNSLLALNERALSEVATLSDAQKHKQLIEDKLTNNKLEEHALQEKLIQHEQAKEILNKQKNECELITFQLKLYRNATYSKQEQVRLQLKKWRTINQQQKQLHNYQELETKKQHIKTELQIVQQKAHDLMRLREQVLQHTQTILLIEQKIQIEAQDNLSTHTEHLQQVMAQQKIKEEQIQHVQYNLEQTAQVILETEKQLLSLEQTEANAQLFHDEFSKERTSFDRRKQYYQTFSAKEQMARKEYDALKQKMVLVQDEYCPACPLCEQNLSASRKRFLKNKFAQSEHIFAHRVNRLQRTLIQLKEILIQQHELLKQKEHKAQLYAHLPLKKQELIEQKKKYDELQHVYATQLSQLKNEHIEIEKQVTQTNQTVEMLKISKPKFEQYPEYIEQKKLLTSLEQQITKSTYNPLEQPTLENELQNIERAQSQYEHLKTEVAQQSQRKQMIIGFCIELKQLKQEILTTEQKITTYAHLDTQEKVIERDALNYSVEKNKIFSEREQLVNQKAVNEHCIQQLQKHEAEIQERTKQIEHNNTYIENLQIISNALGKDGLQALLIEQAIPEIEAEANALLSKLSDNQSHIIIESVRDLKRGGTRETLDIKISDSLGVRPYELFSGGEAFRIDFSIRVAISKLLAKRAGTALQTLIIDEGFGSQDEDGLQRIMDAIYRIQDDFSKIIVVSHLPAMKEQFPVHFVVHKDTEGSKITIYEQG